jgi:hypothetical protein
MLFRWWLCLLVSVFYTTSFYFGRLTIVEVVWRQCSNKLRVKDARQPGISDLDPRLQLYLLMHFHPTFAKYLGNPVLFKA